MRRLIALLVLAPLAAFAQYAAPGSQGAEPPPAAPQPPAPALAPEAAAASPAPAQPGLPPFLAQMQRHDVEVRVVREGGGPLVDAPVMFHITAGGARVREYPGKTDAQGVARFVGIPTNPEVQNQIGYVVDVQSDGVVFPFAVDRIPTDGGRLELSVPAVGVDTSVLRVEHGMIELFPDEESLVARHEMRLFNDSASAVNVATLPGGGLALPLPEGAKHPELHGGTDGDLVEVRGTDLIYKGLVLPAGSPPAMIRVIYTIPYGPRTFAWRQTLPVRASGGMVIVSRDKQPQQQTAVPLELVAGDPGMTVEDSALDGGRRFQVLRGDGLKLGAGQAMQFAVKGLPSARGPGIYVLLVAVALVLLVVLFGFRRSPAEAGSERLSRAHLEIERDRLVTALRRMRKAVQRGQMSQTRFEREQEAINARLVSIFRALDRLDAR